MPATTEKKLIAFHGKTSVQTKYLNRVRAHHKADQIVQSMGGYWDGHRGCAVGCTLHGSSHYQYEVELGIPAVLARLEDRIFENLPNGLALTWPIRFLEAPKLGADLSLVWSQFAVWMLVDPKDGVIKFAKTDRTRKAIQDVADLYQQRLAGSEPSVTKWSEARSNAYAAAADAYAAAAAAYAAAAAAYAAAAAAYAADAADAAAAAAYADAAAARKKFFVLASEKLLQLMSEAPVITK